MTVLSDPAFKSFVRYLRIKGRGASTLVTYEQAYRLLSDYLGRPGVTASRLDLMGFVEYRLQSVSATTVVGNVRSLRSFFSWAVTEELITSNPTIRFPLPTVEETNPRVFTEGELKRLLKATAGPMFSQRRDHAIIRVLCEPGSPRRGELIGMTVDSVDLSTDLIRVSGKTGSRSIPIGTKTGRALELYLRSRANHRLADSPNLWLGLHGPLGREGLAGVVKLRAKQAGITGSVHPHQFRHTAASRASESGWHPGFTDGTAVRMG